MRKKCIPFCDFLNLSSDACEAKQIAAAATDTGLRLQNNKVNNLSVNTFQYEQ